MGENNEEIVKWEDFMPRTVLRVLLIEPDDSTRQILTALLRKCNYQVAAIADGLQAWEILKRRHNCIDLILTELDIPSISGYPLLTLITEHESCKNIPVIVMSSEDSISVVVKCMLKGAADFLIKPVRKNELKNLWRHVWRKLTINGQYSQNLAIEQHETKAAFVNNPTTKPSANTVSTSQKTSKCSEKATDTQSCCTTSYLENKETEQILKNVKMEKEIIPSKESEHCRGAMNLIDNMNKPMCMAQASSDREFQSLNSTPELQLSLKRPHDLETKEGDERHSLNHSNASNFSGYNSNKMSQGSCAFVFNGGVWTEYDPMIQPIFGSPMGHGTGPAAKSSSLSDRGTRNFSVDNSSGQAESAFSNQESEDPHGYSSSQVVGLSGSGESGLTDVNTNGPGTGSGMARTSAVEKVVKDENCNILELNQIGHATSHQTNHSAEREAALARFRLKRKERCYDKKVLYQSRKKIADQRPRVKGQFVRQVEHK